jgi:hypothetical protein
MRVIIAGSRSITNPDIVKEAVEKSGFEITTVISGDAIGVDRLGMCYAFNKHIPVEIHKPKWDVFGKYAGFVRNTVMANRADALIAVWDGKSKGTKNMIDTANEKGLKVFTLIYYE